MKISQKISDEIKRYKLPRKIVKGYLLDWYEIVRRIMLYQADRFVDRPEDDTAIFWNISSPQSPHFKKNIDLDTNNLKPEGRGETNLFQSWVLKIKYEKWARDFGLGLILNNIIDDITDFGTAIGKKVPFEKGYTLENCRLDKVFFDTMAKSFEETSVIEEHNFTREGMEEKKDVWENIEEALKDKKEDFIVYERVGKYDKKLMHHIITGEGDKEIILFEEEADENIYYLFSLDNARGRLPGVGVYERLFKLQERVNTLINENAQTTAIASLLLLRSQDPNTQGNVLEGAISGQIITSADLQQIGIDNRFLNGFLAEMNLIDAQARKLCMTPEVVTGETLPSGTPFRSMAMLTGAAKTAFKSIRDDIGIILSDILLKQILPSLVDDWNKEEVLNIADNDQDLKIYDEAVARFAQTKYIQNKISKGEYAEDEELLKISERAKSEIELKGRKIKTGKKFFNFEYGFIINPTGENYDKGQQNDAYFNALMLQMQNPAVFNSTLAKQYLENNGIQWWKLSAQQIQTIKQSAIEPTAEAMKIPQNTMMANA